MTTATALMQRTDPETAVWAWRLHLTGDSRDRISRELGLDHALVDRILTGHSHPGSEEIARSLVD